MKSWEKLQELTLPGDYECPEFFEIAVDGNPREKRWIFYGANGRYLVGKFDGRTFAPESGPKELHHGNCWYASQTFNDIPAEDGRRILVPWGRMTAREVPFHQGMPFNQMMGLPVELTLRSTQEGPMLFANPVKEIDRLRSAARGFESRLLRPNENPLADFHAELADVVLELAPLDAAEIVFNFRGIPVTYNAVKQELACAGVKAPLVMENGVIRLRVLVDRTSLDIFGNGGRLYMPMGRAIDAGNRNFEILSRGGNCRIHSLKAFELESAWK